VALPAGTGACFFSDGLVEARREGQQLGREHLASLLAELGPKPAARELIERVRAAAQGASDDMVACLLWPQAASVPQRLHVEELEADSQSLQRTGVRRFLRECRVSRPETERALEQAAAIAGSSGTALLRVELRAAGSTVSVAPPGSVKARATPSRRSAAVEQPLLEALAAAG
jgi:hypothetical protein